MRSVPRLILLVTLLITAVPAVAAPRAFGGIAADTSPVQLYVATGGDWNRYQPVDPLSLADLPDGQTLDLSGLASGWAISADGSTIVTIETPQEAKAGSGNNATVVVRDGETGAERIRYPAPGEGTSPTLSADGNRLILRSTQFGSTSGWQPPTWDTVDTATGMLLATISSHDQSRLVGLYHPLIDPSALRLYVATVPPTEGPWPLSLVAYDLATGTEAGRLELADVLAESWWGRSIDQAPVNDILSPAIALSPDGRLIAVVHADREAVTLIDAERLTVERTVALRQPESFLDRLFGLLSLAPQTAEAKYFDGRILDAVFAPDARYLYLYGREARTSEDEITERGLGLMRLDLEDGTIEATALADEELDWVTPSPDGQSVYALGPVEPWALTNGQPRYRLFRLDAATLTVDAAREFAQAPGTLLLPAEQASVLALLGMETPKPVDLGLTAGTAAPA